METINKVRATVFEHGQITAIPATYACDEHGTPGPQSLVESTRNIAYDYLPKDLATRLQADLAELEAWILADVEAKDEAPLKRYLPTREAITPIIEEPKR